MPRLPHRRRRLREVDPAPRARPLRGPFALLRARALARGHQPAHALAAPARAGGGGHRRAPDVRRGPAPRRVPADRQGPRPAAHHRLDARIRHALARRGLHVRCRVEEPRPRPSNPTGAMRSHTLHSALRAFTEEAGGLLAGETARGSEIPFELVEEGGRARTPLYCYRPLTGEFVRAHASALEGLPSHPAAVRALSEHADRLPRYLSALGERPAGGTTAAMNAFLAAVYAEQTDFTLEGARFERAYAQLEDALFAGRTDAT